MSYLTEFLKEFSDQALANLQASAEDGWLRYESSNRCLLAHHQDGYAVVKGNSVWAGLAEHQFLHMNRTTKGFLGTFKLLFCDSLDSNEFRREQILPLIHAEWERRDQLATPAPKNQHQRSFFHQMEVLNGR